MNGSQKKLNFPQFIELYNSTYGMDEYDFKLFLQGKKKPIRSTPQVHKEMAEALETAWWNNDQKFLILAYRHLGKSWLYNMFCVWLLYRDPNTSILMISAGQALATDNVSFMRDIIETFHICKFLIPENKTKWAAASFTVDRSKARREPSVKVLSVTGRITGNHADIIVCDDIEVSDNSNTEEARNFIRTRFREFFRLCPKVWMLGTPHSEESVYKYAEEELNYIVRRWAVYKQDGSPRAPEMGHDIDWISNQKKTSTEGEFKSQYLLIPAQHYETLIDTDLLKKKHLFNSKMEIIGGYRDSLGNLRETYAIQNPQTGNKEIIKSIKAYWDPASGLAGNDDSVLAIMAYTEQGHYFLLRICALPPVNKEIGFETQIIELIKLCEEHLVDSVYVETTGIGFGLDAQVNKLCVQLNKKFHIRDFKRQGMNKRVFMANMIDGVTKARLLFINKDDWQKTKLAQQLEALGVSKKDDFTDALAGVICVMGYEKHSVMKSRDMKSLRGGVAPVSVMKKITKSKVAYIK